MKPYYCEISEQQEGREDLKASVIFFFFNKRSRIKMALDHPRETLETRSQNYEGKRFSTPRIMYSNDQNGVCN